MIEFRDVTLRLGDHAVLERISFKAQFYERIAILGRSGSGKTTILKLMVGLVRPDEGKILVDGQDITELSESQMRDARMNFSIVFQEGALFDSLSVRENVAFCLKEHSRLSEEEIDKRVRVHLRRLGIEEAIDLMPEELSGGMQRRVAIARSLAECEPRMVLYDEPTTGLDPISADYTIRLIKELSNGELPDRLGFFVVTHEVMYAAKVAERFMYLRDKKIGFDGSINELRSTKDPELKTFINQLFGYENRV